jgi:hypothetical protein
MKIKEIFQSGYRAKEGYSSWGGWGHGGHGWGGHGWGGWGHGWGGWGHGWGGWGHWSSWGC